MVSGSVPQNYHNNPQDKVSGNKEYPNIFHKIQGGDMELYVGGHDHQLSK